MTETDWLLLIQALKKQSNILRFKGFDLGLIGTKIKHFHNRTKGCRLQIR